MEAQSHTVGDVFLGYNRSILSGALRSTQEKEEAIKQQTNCKKRPRFFELLATVAGQFLQNDGDFEGNSEFIDPKGFSNDCKRLMLDTEASHLVEIPIPTNCQLNLNIHCQEDMFMKHDCSQATVEGGNNVVENEQYIISKDPSLNNDNASNITKLYNQIRGENLSQEAMNRSQQQVYTLSQSHDPICESFNLFHDLHLNFEGLQAISSFFNNKNSESKNIDACKNTCFSKKENLEILCDDSLNVQTTEKEHNVLIKSLISDSKHLGCINPSRPINSVENMDYLNCKTIEMEDVKSFIKDHDKEKKLQCDEIERTRKKQFSQESFYDEIMNNPPEDIKSGIKPCETTTNSNNALKLQKNQPHEDDPKPMENVAPTKQAFFNGIATCTRQRTSRRIPLKRKQFEDGNKCSLEPQMNTNYPINVEYNAVYGEPPAAAAKLRRAASVALSPNSKGAAKISTKKFVEPHVKFGINSFTIPEFFVDLPESASISTLKEAIMEATMRLLEGPLRVRVLMHGNKVMDEGATLLQSGIISSSSSTPPPHLNYNSNSSLHLPMDAVSFMLEPSSSPSSPCAMFDNHAFQLHSSLSPSAKDLRTSYVHGANHIDPLPLPRFQAYGISSYSHFQEIEASNRGRSNILATKSNLTERMALLPHSMRVAAVEALAAIRAQADSNRRSKNDETPFGCSYGGRGGSKGIGLGLGLEECGTKPMVVHYHPHGRVGMHGGGLALVPLPTKPRPLDITKRRVRRPFSVVEVEALVHAVEKLGTGRWRDVKIQAFEQAKHRTYVDLKDKWKTLVHTARIAPHQRRGEPVPQELLERVTRAHTYWTTQAAKQQAELDC
ncbi:uncharacterized protein [Physcomitrium patens]|uniref:uncharacterized protein isoform X3 n=1 Tax=Physcomitrium patens TaxID=3218 RepID=UPI000D15F0E2|nr:uncharacterized protein LOC112294623 isoform X3 [Physcomitrium patens]|eukprot:XP_024401065.1 uncharacterized protein LOC112294623 isoform X3 [Physcomitrella patens]